MKKLNNGVDPGGTAEDRRRPETAASRGRRSEAARDRAQHDFRQSGKGRRRSLRPRRLFHLQAEQDAPGSRTFIKATGRPPTEAESRAYIIGESTERRLATYRHLAAATLAGQGPEAPTSAPWGCARRQDRPASFFIVWAIVLVAAIAVLGYALHAGLGDWQVRRRALRRKRSSHDRQSFGGARQAGIEPAIAMFAETRSFRRTASHRPIASLAPCGR